MSIRRPRRFLFHACAISYPVGGQSWIPNFCKFWKDHPQPRRPQTFWCNICQRHSSAQRTCAFSGLTNWNLQKTHSHVSPKVDRQKSESRTYAPCIGHVIRRMRGGCTLNAAKLLRFEARDMRAAAVTYYSVYRFCASAVSCLAFETGDGLMANNMLSPKVER